MCYCAYWFVCAVGNRHITATNFFVEPVDSTVRDLLIIDRLTNEIILTSMNIMLMMFIMYIALYVCLIFCQTFLE